MIILPNIANCADDEFDGYKMGTYYNDNEKAALLSGFLLGYRMGELSGQIKGSFEGGMEALAIYEKNTGMVVDKQVKQQFANGLGAKILYDGFTLVSFKTPSPEIMVQELGAFYKTYPLCKKNRIDAMLKDFISVWRTEDKKTFKEVGEQCARYAR